MSELALTESRLSKTALAIINQKLNTRRRNKVIKSLSRSSVDV